MKKIMLISPRDNNFYNFRGELILKLRKEGKDVILVCPYGHKIDYFTDRGCRFIEVQVDRRGMNPLNDLKLIFNYYKIISDEKPEIVLTYTSKPSIYGGIVCKFLKVPYIVNNAGLMKSNFILDKFMNLLYGISFNKACCIMYQNKYEKDVLNRILKNRVHYQLIPGSGVNLENYNYSLYPDDDCIVFNFVARIVKIKGIDEFLECAKTIKREFPNTKFVVYGDYDDDGYRNIINSYEQQGYIEYGGILLDMKPAIKKAHAVIHPSYYEGMTNVILEHSAMGRVCIGSDVPGVADAIEDNKTGYVFECKNVQSLISKVRQFLNLTREEKIQMGRAARTKMEEEFDRNLVTKAYLREINNVLNSKGRV